MCRPVAYPIFTVLTLLLGCAKATFVPVDAQSGVDDVNTCVNPVTPKPNCQVQSSSPCDPVCQSGTCNWCNQKCTLAGDGTTVCAGSGKITSGNTCTIYLLATAQQHDECQPGDICLSPVNGATISYCFTLCHSLDDCAGGVACAPRTLSSSPMALVCDPAYTSCDPAAAAPCCDPLASTAASTGCPEGRFCYLVIPDSSGHSRTTCEYATGGGGRGDACQSSRDCLAKYVCAPSAAGTSGTCQRVCNKATPCTSGSCVDLGAEYGYCPL
jgi:hypothetical protein